MPIRADHRHFYGAAWRPISLAVRQRAGWRCETCDAINGLPNPATGSIVVLTVAHLDHHPTNNDPTNLRALCQRCHLAYDARHHAANAARTRRARMRTPDLFEEASPA